MPGASASAAAAITVRIMTFLPPCAVAPARRSFRGFTPAARARPALGQGVVGRLGIDPNLAAGFLACRKFNLFPERRTGLEVIHEKLGGGERVLPVGGSGDDEDDVFARLEPAIAVDDGDAEERPAPLGRLHVARDLGLGHAWVMLKRHGRERGTALVAAADAGEGDHGADIAAAVAELCRLAGGVERLALQSDGGGHLRLRPG